MDQKELLSTIQQLSERLKIPKPTLRFWEKELGDLITPRRTAGGQRRYTYEHIALIEKIKSLRKKGISLAEIKKRFNDSKTANTLSSNEIDILAKRLENVIREEIHKFYNLEPDRTQIFNVKTV